MNSLEKAFTNQGEQIGAMGIAFKVLVASLHQSDIINGRAIVQNLRLAKPGFDVADSYLDHLAVALSEQLDVCDREGPLTLKAIDPE